MKYILSSLLTLFLISNAQGHDKVVIVPLTEGGDRSLRFISKSVNCNIIVNERFTSYETQVFFIFENTSKTQFQISKASTSFTNNGFFSGQETIAYLIKAEPLNVFDRENATFTFRSTIEPREKFSIMSSRYSNEDVCKNLNFSASLDLAVFTSIKTMSIN